MSYCNDMPAYTDKEIKRKGLLISVSGPSGVGKGSIINKVRQYNPQVAHSVSVTTRSIRHGEEEGVSYFFRTKEQFETMIAKGEILEHDQYLDNYYGTPLPPLLDLIYQGKDVLFDLTVSGSLALMKSYPEVVTVFLLPPSLTELKNRLETRGTEAACVIEKRLLEAIKEVPMARHFDYVVINDNIELAVQRIFSIIEAEQHRYSRLAGIENQILEK